jgi:hypothetical protein
MKAKFFKNAADLATTQAERHRQKNEKAVSLSPDI